MQCKLHAEAVKGLHAEEVARRMRRMKTSTALKKAGSKNKLAALAQVTRQSIQKWGEDVPAKREAILREACPAWFRKAK